MATTLSTAKTQRPHTWGAWKTLYLARGKALQHDEDDGVTYLIWFYDSDDLHYCSIWQGTVPDGFDQTQNDIDKADFEVHFRPISNKVLDPLTSDGRQRISNEKPNVAKTNFFMHNLCDPTTWYTNSIYVTGETATDSGDHTTYTFANKPIVDVYHGKINQEDYLSDSSARSYRVAVKVNGSTKVERNPHFAAVGGGPSWDFTIDYVNGTVTFQSVLLNTDVVTLTYHWVNTTLGNGSASLFRFKPSAGKKLTVNLAKCQFSTDVDLQDTVMFQVMGSIDTFAPQLLIANGGPYPSGTKIPIMYNPYKTVSDIAEDAQAPMVSTSAIGAGGNWRSAVTTNVFRWDYVAGTVIASSMGMEIQIFLSHDRPTLGTRATVTLYCLSETE